MPILFRGGGALLRIVYQEPIAKKISLEVCKAQAIVLGGF